jgi:hypothetical protein
MLEGAVEAASLPVLGADAEHNALPAGLLISPNSSPPVIPPVLPTTHHLPIQNTTPEPPQPNLFVEIVQEEDMENGSDDEGLDAYLEDIPVQPDGSTQQPSAPTELGGLAALLGDLMQPAPLPLLEMPELVPVQLSAKPRRQRASLQQDHCHTSSITESTGDSHEEIGSPRRDCRWPRGMCNFNFKSSRREGWNHGRRMDRMVSKLVLYQHVSVPLGKWRDLLHLYLSVGLIQGNLHWVNNMLYPFVSNE